jgi:hypothetical protein
VLFAHAGHAAAKTGWSGLRLERVAVPGDWDRKPVLAFRPLHLAILQYKQGFGGTFL